MKISIEQFLEWHHNNMSKKYYKTDNKLFEFYIFRQKDYVGYYKRIITCGYCNKTFQQERVITSQKYCSFGCQQAASQLRARKKRRNEDL